jgi:lysophospholipase L1-like esterase
VLRIVALVGSVLVLVEAVLLLLMLRQAVTYPKYWAARAAEPVRPNDLRVVAVGDSAAVGIGAWRPQESLVGRIVNHLRVRTGRPVHVTNLAVGGATVGSVLERQRAAEFATADVVIVVAGSADAGSKVAPAKFRADLRKLAELVPAERTILSDVPLQRGREPYQRILADVADSRRIAHADFATAFRTARRIDVFAPDFTHVNSTGYRIWFEAFRPHLDAIVDRS